MPATGEYCGAQIVTPSFGPRKPMQVGMGWYGSWAKWGSCGANISRALCRL